MKFSTAFGIVLLLGLLGCNATSSPPSAPISEPSTIAPNSSTASPQIDRSSRAPVNSPNAASARATEPETAPTAQPVSPEPIKRTQSGADTSIRRDYAATAPLPATGKVTLRDDIRGLDTDRLISPCPSDSAPYAYAESTHYRVQVCSKEYDPWLPKYYIGQARDGSGELRITNSDVEQANQLIFKHQGYTYVIYRDGARPEQMNAYLEVHTPDGKTYAEALFYLYENMKRPTS